MVIYGSGFAAVQGLVATWITKYLHVICVYDDDDDDDDNDNDDDNDDDELTLNVLRCHLTY